MKLSLLDQHGSFCVAELSSMLNDNQLVRYFDCFKLQGEIDTASLRVQYLKLIYGKRARAKTQTAIWVERGGDLPDSLHLVEDR